MDPCSTDSDGDGAGDLEEVRLCLDPTDPSEPVERQSWILDACSSTDTPEAETVTASNGIWKFDISGRIQNYSQIPYEGTERWVAAGAFDVPAIDAEGAVISFPVGVSNTDNISEYILDELIRRRFPEQMNLQVAREGPAHDVGAFISGRWQRANVSTESPRDPASVRNQLLADVSGLSENNLLFQSTSPSTTSSTFEVGIGIGYQPPPSNCHRQPSDIAYTQIVFAVSPNTLGHTQRQFLRFSTLPERINWGNSTTASACRKAPLAIAPMIQDPPDGRYYRFDARVSNESRVNWMPGTVSVKAAGQPLVPARNTYIHHLDSNRLWVADAAWPEDWPDDIHRFVSFQHQAWRNR